MDNQNNEKKEKKTTKVIIIILILIILLLLSFITVIALTGGKLFNFGNNTITEEEIGQHTTVSDTLPEDSTNPEKTTSTETTSVSGSNPSENTGEETSPEYTAPIIAGGEDFDGDLNFNDISQIEQTESIVIPGFTTITTDRTHGNMKLVNPTGNDVLFKYTIKYKGGTVYTSDYILPGKQIFWNVLSAFPNPGTYELEMIIETIDENTYAPQNGAVQTVSLTIL